MKKNKATRVGVEKGFGPRHAMNAQEGEDLTQQNTDSVPAMLTPREAVLDRNAAELAGRGAIEKLNAEGNALAQKGVDLAGGETNMKTKAKKMQGGGQVQGGPAKLKNAPGGMPVAGNNWMPPVSSDVGIGRPSWAGGGMPGMQGGQPGYSGPKFGSEGWQSTHPQFHQNYFHNANTGDWQRRQLGGMPGMGTEPAQRPPGYLGPPMQQQPLGPMPRSGGGFYPPGQGMYAGGTGDVQGPIGSANPQQAYGPAVQLSAPDLAALLAKAGQAQGLSPSQIAGLTQAFQSFGGGGGDGLYSGGAGTSPLEASGGFQGGISDIGYPPMIGPKMQYHADKGSTWTGPYDPAFLVERYARGTSSVPFR